MVDEAARAGVKLAAHVWTRQGAHNAAPAGVASMEHLNGVEEQDLETAKKNGTTAVFTPFPLADRTPAAEVTSNAARLLGVDTDRGTLAVGKAADIIATPENPFAHIATLKSVSFVMKNGRVIRAPGASAR